MRKKSSGKSEITVVEDRPLTPTIEGKIKEVAKPKEEVRKDLSSGADIFTMDVRRIMYPATGEYTDDYLNTLEGWQPVFNGWDIDDWRRKGTWYVSNRVIVGEPHGASLVRCDINEKNYQFKFKTKKLAGADGFIAIFQCSNKCYAWIIGGWHNTRSEVMKVIETKSSNHIEEKKWYEVKVSVQEKIVEGYLNDLMIWSIDRAALEKYPSQDVFLQGTGFGVWNTTCKFRDVYILKK